MVCGGLSDKKSRWAILRFGIVNWVTPESLGSSVMVNELSVTNTMPGGVITMLGSRDEIWKLFVDARPSITNSSSVLAPVMVLGSLFLRHVQRTRLLFHLLDIGSVTVDQAVAAVRTIEKELQSFSFNLMDRPRWLVCTKTDLLSAEETERKHEALLAALNWQAPAFAISSVRGGEAIATLKYRAMQFLEQSHE